MNETLNKKMENLEIVSIPDFPEYFAGIDGYIYSTNKGSFKKLSNRLSGTRSDRVGYYRVILYKNKSKYHFSVHRLIANVFLYKENERTQVDHINGNTLDNRLDNLRWVTPSENIRNRIKTKSNNSGIVGVYFLKGKYECDYWVAHWTKFNGKLCQKLFSIKKYGYEQAKQLAIDYRKEMEKIYYPTKESFD